MKYASALFIFLSLTAPVKAEATAGDLLKEYDSYPPGRVLWEQTLAMTENAFGWANTEIQSSRNQNPLYCAPENLALTGNHLVSILRGASEKQPIVAQQPFGLALLYALQKAYPCTNAPVQPAQP